jgi:eukaryotic-like serine/threonine-protein kinase
MSEPKPAVGAESAATLSAPAGSAASGLVPVGTTGDPFGIVGTMQAGSFQIERVVAEGGFGVVYRAQHGHFRAPVAIKCLKVPGTLDASQRRSFLEKFRHEAELLFRLSASISQVVRPLHVDELALPDGRFVPFLALEWLDGQSLSVLIARRRAAGKAPMSLPKILALLQPIARAMARAHCFPAPDGEMAIIHRDIKPENIFVQEVDGREVVRILDYGIAKARAAASTGAGRATEDDVNIFTPGYAAPEQWVPKRFGQTGPFTDVYGLALTMVEALTGAPPIEGELHTMFAIAVDEAARPTPRAYGVSISDDAEAAFARALAVDPRTRTQSIPELWSSLERALGLPLTFPATPSSAPATSQLGSIPPLMGYATPPPPAAEVAPSGPPALELSASSASPSLGASSNRPNGAAVSSDLGDIVRGNDPGELSESFRAGGLDLQLDLGAGPHSSGRPAALRRRPLAPTGTFASPPEASSWPEVRRKLEGPTKVLVFAALITAADIIAVRFFETTLAVGPVRASWVAAAIAVLGVIAAIRSFLSD